MFHHSFSSFHRSLITGRQRRCSVIVSLGFSLVLGACASGGFVDKSMELVGLKKPDVLTGVDPESIKLNVPSKVTLRIHAGQVLNTDANGRSLSLVTRIYKLRSSSQFAQATYASLSAASADKRELGDDVVSMQELVLTPGQRYEVIETVPSEVTQIAVIALFRSPDPQRWRFVFDTKGAAKTGITLGAHGCALSVAAGEPVGAQPDALRLAGVQCR